MLEVVLSGLVTGWAIAVPVGAVGAFLVTLTARTSLRVGAAAALGVASVDGLYATLAVVGGAALSSLIEPVAGPLRVGSALVLLTVAAVMVRQAVRDAGTVRRDARAMSPGSAYLLFLGITAVNPATVVYFAAVVLGNHGLVSTPAEGVAFVLAAFAASASWQLTLAGGGAALGRFVSSPRGHLVTGVVSGLVIAALAVWTLVG
ncbi:MAG: LysE family transporter [Nocardioidaceae bacterium]